MAMLAGLAAALGACGDPPGGPTDGLVGERLRAFPAPDTVAGAARGVVPLGISAPRDGALYVPAHYDSRTPWPLVLLLHGATGSGSGMLEAHRLLADTLGLLLLAVDSRGLTWDGLRTPFGPDITYIDAALAWTLTRYAVDRSRLVVAGFSDGGSYALALGRANGDRFGRIIAHAPGFLRDVAVVGRPPVFVAHGTSDLILPIDRTSRRIVPALRAAGHTVRYEEWAGPHAISRDLAASALRWALDR